MPNTLQIYAATPIPVAPFELIPRSEITLHWVGSQLGFHNGINMNDWRLRYFAGTNHGNHTHQTMSMYRGRNAQPPFSTVAHYHGDSNSHNIINVFLEVKHAPPYLPVTANLRVVRSHHSWIEHAGQKTGQCDGNGYLKLKVGVAWLRYGWTSDEEEGYVYGWIEMVTDMTALNFSRTSAVCRVNS